MNMYNNTLPVSKGSYMYTLHNHKLGHNLAHLYHWRDNEFYRSNIPPPFRLLNSLSLRILSGFSFILLSVFIINYFLALYFNLFPWFIITQAETGVTGKYHLCMGTPPFC